MWTGIGVGDGDFERRWIGVKTADLDNVSRFRLIFEDSA